MWPGISEAGWGLFRFLNARTVEIVVRGLSRIFHSPQVRLGDTDPRGGDPAPTWPGISEAGFGHVQVSECPDWGIVGRGLVQDFSQPEVRLGDTDPRGWHLRGRGGLLQSS